MNGSLLTCSGLLRLLTHGRAEGAGSLRTGRNGDLKALLGRRLTGIFGAAGGREARGDDGNFHLVADVGVDAGTEDDVRRIIDHGTDETRRGAHFVKGEVVAADDVEEHAGRALDGRIEQRAVDGELDRLHNAVFALGDADAHMREPPVFEDGAHVGKVEVDERRRDDEVRNAADTLLEHFVRDAQRIRHGRVPGHDFADLLVGDDDERIHVFAEVIQPLHGIVEAAFALELERFGDDGDRKDLEVLGDLGDDGRRARARAAAHTGRDEQKVGIFNGVHELVFVFFRGSAADVGIRARTQPLGEFGADLDLALRARAGKDLRVGIHRDVFRARDPRFDHSVDGIVPRAADADDLDTGFARDLGALRRGLHGFVHNLPPKTFNMRQSKPRLR